MAKLSEELLKTLQQLGEEEFKHFKWFLKQGDTLKGFPGIPVARLEKADRHDTVDLMVQKYQDSGALSVTLTILGKISRNDLMCHLQQTTSVPTDLKSHQSVPVKSDYERRKTELKDKIKLMIQERQMKIREIKHLAALSRRSADRHIADSKQVFSDLLQSVEKSLTDLIDTLNEKRKTRQKKAEKFIKELEQEISELKRTSDEMEQDSRTKDQPDFLKSFSSLSIPETKNWSEVTTPSYGESLVKVVDELKEKLSAEREKLIAKAKLNRVQEFAKDVTLDPDTANPFLILSEHGKKVHCGDVKQNLPDNPKRFDTASNVLGKQNFSSGRFYYEVRVEGKTSWDLGVVKESIDRNGSIKASPENGYWTICLRDKEKYSMYGSILSVKHQPKKVGVFVDYEKGSVCFYDVDSADIIHKFTDCSFTEKLYPFFSPGCPHGGKNSAPLIISPVSYQI